jgi:hypothetical protein
VIILKELTDKPHSPFYEQLLGKVDEHLLHLQDTRGTFLLDKINEKNLNYYLNQLVDMPWNDHLLLSILVYADTNVDVKTINNVISGIHPRLNDIFGVFQLKK